MFGWGHHEGRHEDAHRNVYGGHAHHASWTHELLAAAVAFEAMRKYEQHQREKGEEVSHPLAKELLAAFVGAELDKWFETKGLDHLDREEATRLATEGAHGLFGRRHGG
jgi:deoxyribodipyrimidine photolyase-like uncharacterized protein